jgi:hypothetical protein
MAFRVMRVAIWTNWHVAQPFLTRTFDRSLFSGLLLHYCSSLAAERDTRMIGGKHHAYCIVFTSILSALKVAPSSARSMVCYIFMLNLWPQRA